MWTLFRGAQAHELRLRGVQFLPFKSETWAAVCQRTQQCYQVSARLHTLISSPPTSSRAAAGPVGYNSIKSSGRRGTFSPLNPFSSIQHQRSQNWASAFSSSQFRIFKWCLRVCSQTACELLAVLGS